MYTKKKKNVTGGPSNTLIPNIAAQHMAGNKNSLTAVMVSDFPFLFVHDCAVRRDDIVTYARVLHRSSLLLFTNNAGVITGRHVTASFMSAGRHHWESMFPARLDAHLSGEHML